MPLILSWVANLEASGFSQQCLRGFLKREASDFKSIEDFTLGAQVGVLEEKVARCLCLRSLSQWAVQRQQADDAASTCLQDTIGFSQCSPHVLYEAQRGDEEDGIHASRFEGQRFSDPSDDVNSAGTCQG